MHLPPSGPVVPALHVQFVTSVLEAGELEYAGHSKHVEIDVAPTAAEFLPETQSVQMLLPDAVENLPGAYNVQLFSGFNNPRGVKAETPSP